MGGSGGGSGGTVGTGTKGKTIRESKEKFHNALKEQLQPKVRNVFISFHIEDENAVNLLRHQSKDNEFGIHFRDYSVKEPFDSAWKTNCRERISRTSAMIAIIGPQAYQREAVDWEIREALRQRKKVIGVRIHKDRNHPVPRALRENNCRIVDWNLARISKLLAEE